MTSPTFKLICNSKDCHTEIDEIAFVTFCAHIFCEPHGRNLKRNWRECVCPACGSHFSNENCISQNFTTPSTMILSGVNPNHIFEIANNGVTFWNYQQQQQIIDLRKRVSSEIMLSRVKEDSQRRIDHLSAQLQEANITAEHLKRRVMEQASEIEMMRMEFSKVSNKNKAMYHKTSRDDIF